MISLLDIAKTRIFISYRRKDSQSEAGRIYDYLVKRFGKGSVFIDVNDILFGIDFRKELDEAVGSCQILMAVLGPTWLNATDEAGDRRIDSPQDFVRIELESALKRKIPVIPLLVNDAQMPSEAELPDDLKDLAYRAFASIGHSPADFRTDMDRVVKNILLHSNFWRRIWTSYTSDRVSRRRLFAETGVVIGLSLAVAVPLVRTIFQLFNAEEEVGTEDKAEDETASQAEPEIEPVIERDIELPYSEAERKLDATTVEFNVVTVYTQSNLPKLERKPAKYEIEDLGNGISLELVSIPEGSFRRGAKEKQGQKDEYPQRPVTVNAFWMGRYQVTQEQWRAVVDLQRVDRTLNPYPSLFKGDKRPVESVSWYEAIEFCKRISKKTGHEYRLPTESQWEYACRAMTKTRFHFGDAISPNLANYGGHQGSTTKVGRFNFANNFGLYDMHGNVWEWCLDHDHGSYRGAPHDDQVWETGFEDTPRVKRGGDWLGDAFYSRSANRGRSEPNYRINPMESEKYFIGLRVIRLQ